MNFKPGVVNQKDTFVKRVAGFVLLPAVLSQT